MNAAWRCESEDGWRNVVRDERAGRTVEGQGGVGSEWGGVG